MTNFNFKELLNIITHKWGLNGVFSTIHNGISYYDYECDNLNLKKYSILAHKHDGKILLSFYFFYNNNWQSVSFKIRESLKETDLNSYKSSFDAYWNDDNYYLNWNLVWDDYFSWDLSNPKSIESFYYLLDILGFKKK